ncbi:MAG: hydantoinase/carbamoylase family amidase, partial [Acidimicrobiales bacterium]
MPAPPARDTGRRPDGERLLRTLHRLAEATSDTSGAQRVAWTETWRTARELLLSELDALPVEVSFDAAANLWARLPGAREETVVIGSHLDSVPDGGWLDGAYGVMCALEVLRTVSGEGELPCSVALVDWADEEGARFGRSLFGSAAAAGTLDVEEVRSLTDRHGARLVDVLASWEVDLDALSRPLGVLGQAAAYLEAHIEQGPVLERAGVPIAAVTATAGVERHRVSFSGRSAHSGSTPMDRRRDPFLPAAATALEVRDAAVRHGGVGTVGSAQLRPGIVTAVAEEAIILVDQRHLEAEPLQTMLEEVRAASERAASAEGCTVAWQPVFRVAPQPFNDYLVSIVRDACARITGRQMSVPSGALHDATEIARAVPTAMVFTSSIQGVSHNKQE